MGGAAVVGVGAAGRSSYFRFTFMMRRSDLLVLVLPLVAFDRSVVEGAADVDAAGAGGLADERSDCSNREEMMVGHKRLKRKTAHCEP